MSFGLALNMPHKNKSVFESLQLLIKGLSLTRVVDYVGHQLGVGLNCLLQILAKPGVKILGEGLRPLGELFEIGIDLADGLDVGVLDVVEIGLFILGRALFDLVADEGEVVLGLVLVEFDESLRGEPAVLKHFDYFQQVLQQDHQESAFLFFGEQEAVHMLDHVVNKFAEVEIAQQNAIVVANEVSLFRFLLHSVAVRGREQVLNYLPGIPEVLVGEVEVLQIFLGHPSPLIQLAALNNELFYFFIGHLPLHLELCSLVQFNHELGLSVAFPRGLPMEQFVEDYSKGKDVSFDRVVALDQRLDWHVEGSANIYVIDKGP